MSILWPPVGDEHKPPNSHQHNQNPQEKLTSNFNAKSSSADDYFSLELPIIQPKNDDVDKKRNQSGLGCVYPPLHSRLYLPHAVFTVVGSVPHWFVSDAWISAPRTARCLFPPALGEEGEEEEGWRWRRVVVVVVLLLVMEGVSLADFSRGSTQSFLHRCKPPTTSSVLDFHTEEYHVCVREITAFHEILIDPASWTRRGREREREGMRGEGWRGVEGGYSFAQPLSCSHYQHRYRLHPSLPRSISLKKANLFHLLSDHDHNCWFSPRLMLYRFETWQSSSLTHTHARVTDMGKMKAGGDQIQHHPPSHSLTSHLNAERFQCW